MNYSCSLALKLVLGAAGTLAVFVPAAAQKNEAVPAGQVARVAACLDVANDADRLACFDREAGSLRTAVKERKIVVVQQADIAKARRTLFGIPVPRIGVLESDGAPEKEITAVIKSTAQGEGGRLTFTLEDGAVWAQTDEWPVYSVVKAGQKVTLKRGMFGSYFADFERAPTVRAKRLR